jgi:hypothetical protein
MRHKLVHLLSLASIMPIKKRGVKGEEEIALAPQGASWLYSPSCREGLFSETRLPVSSILGNWASGSSHSRKLSFRSCRFSETRLTVRVKVVRQLPKHVARREALPAR